MDSKCLILLILSCVVLAHAEIFSALATLTKALETEKELGIAIRDYIKAEQQRLALLAKVAENYETHAEEALADPEVHLANPINAYLFVKKFTSDLPALKELMSSEKNFKAYQEVLLARESAMPTEEDLDGVVDAILRLQDTYEIPAHKMRDGSFVAKKSSPILTAGDCFVIGRLAFDKGDKYHSLMWLLESLTTLESNGDDGSVDKELLYDYLTYSADNQGNQVHALKYCQEYLKYNPTSERMLKNREYFQRLVGQALPPVLPRIKNKKVPRRDTMEYKNYESLCRDEDILPNPYLHKLTCHYENRNRNPLLVIAPIKVETIYLDPPIALFHDVISDNEIAIVKNLSKPLLKRAVVNDPATGKLVTATYRVSRSSWLKDEMHPTIRTITNRIEAATHLSMETVEDLQVVNYGIGGQYEPHFDHARKNEPHQFDESIGNRIATWIYYLSDVEAGGLTVFTNLGVKVPPVKGAAAFWYNLRKSGEGDSNTRHAGCPVLAGSKWVANKWIHVRGQEFVRPCGLTEDEVDILM